MEIKVVSGDITRLDVGAIIVNIFEGETSPGGATGATDGALDGAITKLIEEGEIKGKRGEMTLIHTLDRMVPARVLVAGLGKKEDFDLDRVRAVSAESCRRLRRAGVQTVATIVHGEGTGELDVKEAAQGVAEGAILGLYRFDQYKSKDAGADISELTIVEADPQKLSDLEASVAEGRAIGDAVNFCRDMANEPANAMTPSEMSERALLVANEGEMELEVFDRPQMAELGMGAMLGVAQGSNEPPKFIILSRRPMRRF